MRLLREETADVLATIRSMTSLHDACDVNGH